ncbi:Uncharacterized membrane protein YhaH, DUF805 family [Pseudomonas reinekei]|uniref:DUF805 domain-containing protein n=1 Tax=Pseudomonas reinekei TaxID=395598 RepID=A0A1H0QNV6_PSERE|nr:DUF805 domain-containing protein [Pseudomonas reinekei]KAB0486089.1 DUF805 domain-containing protein [Pseudomonas reinekei]OLU03440.1 hypothetical protein BVK86_09125 [Pseudomonas reinekei]SDP19037.1 Uncharacterized membrane protein YhaH, DUF805 family [Pseudomonas reinekei]
MSENRFKIVFDGALLPGVDIGTAKLNLAALFKSDVTAIERLFSGRPVALKRDLSHADAQTYLQALKNTGIEARIESEPSIELNLSDVHEHMPAAVAEPQSPYAPPLANVSESVAGFATLKPFGVEGRIGRLRFLAWSMVLSLVTMAVVGVFAIIGLALVSSDSTAGLIIGGILAFFLCLAFLIASIMISVQRLHDIGWSGWLWLLNLVPFVGSFFPLLLLAMPGNQTANRYGAPPPPNSTAVKVLSALWLVVIALVIVGALAGGLSAIQDEYENTLESSYQSGSVTTDEIEVEVEPDANSAADAAEEALPPVDSAKE